MKLNVLISTCDEGIFRVPAVLSTPREDVSYIISMQYSNEVFLQQIPAELYRRKDVSILPLDGLGLCRNRNNALRYATGDIAIIADDDVRYCDSYFDTIIETFENDKELDIAQFKIKSLDGGFIKSYPDFSYTYPDVPYGMYITSPEIAIRISTTKRHIYFDERFGLGSSHFICGEEEVLFADAHRQGFTIKYIPQYAVEAPSNSTGTRTYTDKRVMMAKGAVNYYLHKSTAWLRMFKFALLGSIKRKGSFFKLLYYTYKGIYHYKKVAIYESPIGR